MTKTMISARISKVLDEKIEAIAASEKRSKSYIVEEALQIYSEREAWMIARAKSSLSQAAEKGEWISNDLALGYLKSLPTSNPMPFPKPDIVRPKTGK